MARDTADWFHACSGNVFGYNVVGNNLYNRYDGMLGITSGGSTTYPSRSRAFIYKNNGNVA
jgi:hypothetical protein